MAVFRNVFEKKHVCFGCFLYSEIEKWPMASLTALNSLYAKKRLFFVLKQKKISICYRADQMSLATIYSNYTY